jgi:hypothetical protein
MGRAVSQVIYTLPGVSLPEGIDISFKMEDKKLQVHSLPDILVVIQRYILCV